MSSVTCDTTLISARITQLGERAVRGISDVMRDYGELIAYAARSNAPFREGYLEDAIRYEEDRGGIHGRLRVRVYVDGDASAGPNKRVGDYAKLMELHLSPYGSGRYQAGPGTRAKGGDAGGLYFARAVEEYAARLQQRALEIVRRALS